MTKGDVVQGHQVEKQPHELEPGEYTYRLDSEDGSKHWYASTPNGLLGSLDGHEVTEHEDGTISVSPSILVRTGGDALTWHGYLERGVWREV